MAPRADVDTHLGRRGHKIDDALNQWCEPGVSSSDRVAVVRSYFADADLGDSALQGTSVVAERRRAPRGAPTVLVVGSHDLGDVAHPESDPALPKNPATFRGPGVASAFAPTVAFVEGFKASITAQGDEPLNIRFLSVGPGDELARILSATKTDDVDAIFLTNSIAWDANHPTITTGARGRLELRITISAGRSVDDATFAGAIRNPLNKLVELLGKLRDNKGRIAIPDFYRRASPPTDSDRAQLAEQGFDPNGWIAGLDVRRYAGSLSALERATMWPAISVTDISTPDTTRSSTPASASATISIYLIPDQRPVEIESAMRSWVESQVPTNLTAMVTLVSAARPYRSSPDQQAVAAQSRAASRVHRRSAVFVPGGGAIGAGEAYFATGASIGFAGICGPQHGFGSADEVVPRALFDLGTIHAAETCLQLSRRNAPRNTS